MRAAGPVAPVDRASKEAGREADCARTRPAAARSLPRPPGAARRCTAGRVRTARRERPLSGPGPGFRADRRETTLSQAVRGKADGQNGRPAAEQRCAADIGTRTTVVEPGIKVRAALSFSVSRRVFLLADDGFREGDPGFDPGGGGGGFNGGAGGGGPDMDQVSGWLMAGGGEPMTRNQICKANGLSKRAGFRVADVLRTGVAAGKFGVTPVVRAGQTRDGYYPLVNGEHGSHGSDHAIHAPGDHGSPVLKGDPCSPCGTDREPAAGGDPCPPDADADAERARRLAEFDAQVAAFDVDGCTACGKPAVVHGLCGRCAGAVFAPDVEEAEAVRAERSGAPMAAPPPEPGLEPEPAPERRDVGFGCRTWQDRIDMLAKWHTAHARGTGREVRPKAIRDRARATVAIEQIMDRRFIQAGGCRCCGKTEVAPRDGLCAPCALAGREHRRRAFARAARYVAERDAEAAA